MAQVAFKQKVVAALKDIKKDVQVLEAEKKELEQDIEDRNALGLDVRRALHWVLKVGNLKRSVEFYEKVFGMNVIRHEEFDSGCEANCNGAFDRPWSKTMIGYGDEKTQFALELTYNYGIKGYRRGNDLRFIGLCLTEDGLEAATKLGYKPVARDDGKLFYDIVGPDEVKYRCKMSEELPREPFWSVALNVKSVRASFEYWCGALSMQSIEYHEGKYLRASYGGQVPLEFYELNKDESLDHAAAQGRIAFTTSIKKGPYVMNDYIKRFKKYKVLTDPVTLPTPGKADVDVVILADVDGYEICFVNQVGFDDLCTTKEGDEVIDWDKRAENKADRDKGRFIK